jgi:FkbH-like protein
MGCKGSQVRILSPRPIFLDACAPLTQGLVSVGRKDHSYRIEVVSLSLTNLGWLPASSDWSEKLRAAAGSATPQWQDLVDLANFRLDLVKTNRLDSLVRRVFPQPPPGLRAKPIRLAILSSSTVDHLLPAIRVAAVRRNLWIDIVTGDYGQYAQELLDSSSVLYGKPVDVVLFAFDAAHLFGDADPGMTIPQSESLLNSALDRVTGLWRLARERLGCQVIQQTLLPRFPALMGSNEHRLGGSHASLVSRTNSRFRQMADAEGVDLLAIDDAVTHAGLAAFHDPMLWHRAKQEISPVAAPVYGDLLGRLLAARRGLAFKCLVLDLDNTLWGGVIGDDGLEGIKLGQGSALGEAHVGFQRYCKDLSRRGIILAVCSKNDDAVARTPFDSHPEMILRMPDIACFVANWDDKPGNIRTIAERLNIGLDAIAFADDNPFERTIVRRELPMVAVPELPEDPALYAECIANSGFFESVRVTDDDLNRVHQYQANLERERARESFTDMAGYLKSLNMQMVWSPFDAVGLSRIVQLINKTNQFNLTTRRHDEAAVRRFMDDPRAVTMQIRLQDGLGDNGMIAIVIGSPGADREFLIDTWLMSCRVLGRQVEQATMNQLCALCSELGMSRIVGEYWPTAKNGMVRDHYKKLGFELIEDLPDGRQRWQLELQSYTPFPTFIEVTRGS